MPSFGKSVFFLLVLVALSYCEGSDTDRELAENEEHQKENTLGLGEMLKRFKRQLGGNGSPGHSEGKGKGKGFGKGKEKAKGKDCKDWTEWSEWEPSPCKIGETQVRMRACNNGNIVGPIQMQRRLCPIVWGPWTPWSPCPSPYGGTSVRTRTAVNGGAVQTETKTCPPCPWSEWSAWQDCDCEGTQARTRTCISGPFTGFTDTQRRQCDRPPECGSDIGWTCTCEGCDPPSFFCPGDPRFPECDCVNCDCDVDNK